MALPPHFVYLHQVDPSIIEDMKYFSHDNFMGRPVKGYQAAKCILTLDAAQALAKVQAELKSQAMGLKVFDGYRPQQAVEDFIVWSKGVDDQKMKALYYPNIDKAEFFELGYVCAKSAHTRGSTVDLTIVRFTENANDYVELDMGTPFDFMDELSHSLSSRISEKAQANRLFLRDLMQQAGFVPYEKEWWHFTLTNEPFPDTYFDFPII